MFYYCNKILENFIERNRSYLKFIVFFLSCRLSSDLISIYSSTSIENLNDDIWGEFQEHYEYLMDKGLIETCQVDYY